MFIRIGYEWIFSIPAPVSMMLLLYPHPSRKSTLQHPERLRIEPDLPIQEFTDWFGNRCGRFAAPAGRLRLWYDNVVQDSGLPDLVNKQAAQHAVEDLPVEV